MRRFLKAGVIAFIGYLLSPLSWWNDALINLPIAYGTAVLFSLISNRLFVPVMIGTYWLTNIIGMLMMHFGIRGALRNGKPVNRRRELLLSIAIGSGYTALIVLLGLLGILKSPISR